MKSKQYTKSKISPSESAKIHMHFLDMHTNNIESEERQSEQRIKFFLTLTTGTIALIAIFRREGFFPNDLFWITLASLCTLFIYGLLTFARIIWRNRNIDRLNKLKSVSGELLEKLDPSVNEYAKCLSKMEGESKTSPYDIKGTFAQFMYFTEGLLAAGIILTIGIHCNWGLLKNIIMTIYVLLTIPVILFKWSQKIRKVWENTNDNNAAA